MKNVKNTLPIYKRKLVHREYLFYGGYSANIIMVARIKGNVPQKLLRSVIKEMPYRHPLLQVRIIKDKNEDLWFTSEGCNEVDLEVVPRSSDSDWITSCYADYHHPFIHEKGPHAKFTLLYSPNISELIITINHIIGDGMSLGYLVRDILEHLEIPEKEFIRLEPPVFDIENIPIEPKVNFLVKFILKRLNTKWQRQKLENNIYFDDEDMSNIHEIFVTNFQPIFSNLLLSEDETRSFINKCNKEGVTVNSAFLTLLLRVQQLYLHLKPKFKHRTIIPVNIRNRLRKPVGEAFALYASGYDMTYRYDEKKSFWENVRAFHKMIVKEMTDYNIFKDIIIMYYYMDPTLMGDLKYFVTGRLVKEHQSRYDKLHKLVEKKLVINKIIKSKKADLFSFAQEIVLTNIGNLNQINLRRQYGQLELDSLMLAPGANARMRLAIAAVTASGKLNLSISSMSRNYSQDQLDEIKKLTYEKFCKEIK
ncbi:MAG: hypothetical protein EAX96_20690 [Candidatus Lokiarchaeota archaeon]|nr:hypothetical protein [Candidatus Lokiarchaeota archaeon]